VKYTVTVTASLLGVGTGTSSGFATTTTVAAATATVPSPLEPSTNPNCTAYHLVVSGDTCADIEQLYAITADEVRSLRCPVESTYSNESNFSSTFGIQLSGLAVLISILETTVCILQNRLSFCSAYKFCPFCLGVCLLTSYSTKGSLISH
jgi:hypothetical protein